MITPLLEKAIAQGFATYSKFTHAFGMFGGLKIPDGKTCIIVDIKWNQFANPYKNLGNTSLLDFLKYNEYQLKIDGFKSLNYLQYRNVLKLTLASTLGNAYTDTIDSLFGLAAVSPVFFTVGPPIQNDVFFICEKYINLTISRNAYMNTLSSAGNYGLLNNSAAEQPKPNGVKDINVLKRLTMTTLAFGGAAAATMSYTPPNNDNAGLTIPAGGRNAENYTQDLQDISQIYAPDTGFTATMGLPASTNPLVEFGIVTINTNIWDQLANS
jgi:hypothetical protein